MKLPYDLEMLRYPIGRYTPPKDITELTIKEWIAQIRKFPQKLLELSTEISPNQYQWCYRPEGWSILQLIHHCADSHMNAFLRLKWALTEDKPTIKGYDESTWSKTHEVNMPASVSMNLLDGLHERWTNLLDSLSPTDLEKGYYHPETQSFVRLDEYIGNYAWHCEHHFRHMLLALDHEGKYNNL
jgi:hypothetical protein